MGYRCLKLQLFIKEDLVKGIIKICDCAIDVAAILAGILVVGLMISVCFDVVLRYIFNNPIPGLNELAEYALLWITFLGAPWLLKMDGHIRIDIFLLSLSRKGREFVKGLVSGVSAIIMLPIIWYGVSYSVDCFMKGAYIYSVLELPKGAIMLVIPVGSFLLLVEFARSTYASLMMALKDIE